MSGNGNQSYQKYDGATGMYQDIPDGVTTRGGRPWLKWAVGAVVVAAVGVGYATMTLRPMSKATATAHAITSSSSSSIISADQMTKDIMAKANMPMSANGKLKLFDDLNRYVMEDYDAKAAFSSFLPAVAGFFGKPVWSFYVNRGQCIATFGTESKDYPILEFNPANKAYQVTPFVGFRTFVRGTRPSGVSFMTEPFSADNIRNLKDEHDDALKPKRILYVGANEVEIQEIDAVHGLTTDVKYFVLPEENFAALVRRTTFTNVGSTPVTLDVLDGLAKMEPFGGALDWGLKNMGRTLEGWMGVYHASDDLTLPFYRLSTETSDTASVVIEQAGHYCISFIENSEGQAQLLPIVFDTTKVFGQDTALSKPLGLMASSVEEILDNPQYGWAKTSSAFAAVTQMTLAPGESFTIASVYGKADHVELVPQFANLVSSANFIETKFQRTRDIISELSAGVLTKTVNPLFDGTVRQMYMDNSLRGGLPTILGLPDSDATYDEDPRVKVFHTFSRIHGDLERDYNAFNIQPTFFSQGPGNYRDVAQNRRDDVVFLPRMGSFDVQMFLSFIQADGYEPLTVEAVVFRFQDPQTAIDIAKQVTADPKSAEVLGNVLNGGPFRPGQIFSLCDQIGIVRNMSMSPADFINTILAATEDRAMAVYGQGYWGDHWDYYIDLIEAYVSVFPDGEEELMYDKSLRYFFSTATVKPRSQKYVLVLNFEGTGYHVQQLDATFFDQEKVAEQEAFRNSQTGLLSIEANWYRTANGQPFMSAPIAKLFLLGAIKFATRDPYGMAIEYEGGRPGWLDSMNGLPGMVGGGMPETYELKLLLQYVQSVVDKYQRPVVIPNELYKMIKTVNSALHTLENSGFQDEDQPSLAVPQELFEYWDVVAAARENYRNDVQYYFSGNTTSLHASTVSNMITRWLAQIDLGIARSFKFSTVGYKDDGTSGVPATFFAYDITEWEENGGKNSVGHPLVNAKAMNVRKFPQFLEGPVRYMKTIKDDATEMKNTYDKVFASGLRDTILNMYFLSASLKGQTFDMGRQVSFAPGWLENQSIWMHMSYKYYLQLIRGKLYDQFFSEMKGGGVLPFMDPDVYGRSLMECSSFIASSAFPDPSIVGEGFLPRLSGSTAEFMDMWKHMFIGEKLFILNDEDEVEMQLTPVLPSWLFEDETTESAPMLDDAGCHTVMFKLFGAIPVTYHNCGARTLYGENPKSYHVTMASGKVLTFDSPTIPTKTALQIRRVTKVASIDAYF